MVIDNMILVMQVIMENGILKLTMSQPDGALTGIQYGGMKNLLDTKLTQSQRGYKHKCFIYYHYYMGRGLWGPLGLDFWFPVHDHWWWSRPTDPVGMGRMLAGWDVLMIQLDPLLLEIGLVVGFFCGQGEHEFVNSNPVYLA